MTVALPLKARLLRPLARVVLAAERLWRGLWPAQVFVGFYLAIVGFGLLSDAGWIVRLSALTIAAVGLGWGLARLARGFAWPARTDAERRLEADSGLPHRPFAALDDAPAVDDARGAVLWSSHLERMAAAVRRVRLGLPDFSLMRFDPFAFRHGALLCLIAAVVIGWGDLGPRLARAVEVWPSSDARPAAVEFWIDPPAYTGAAPIRPTPALEVVRTPAGSRLKAFAEAADGPPVLVAGKTEIPFEATDVENEYDLETVLKTSGRLALLDGSGEVLAEWPLEVVPDAPPKAAFVGPPAISEGGVLRFDYDVSDDYGVVAADLPMAPADGVPAGGYSEKETLPAPLPQNAKAAKGSLFRDLTAHRWAGRTVELRMRASDAIGQTGESEPLKLPLPEREFTHPVAKAIIAARKELDANPLNRRTPAGKIAKLLREPAAYSGNMAISVAMAVIEARLLAGEGPRSYHLARDMMWETALQLEDGGLSAAELALRKARERLAEALARDASPEEIARLVEELKQALQNFMEAMARAQEQDNDARPMQQRPNQMMQSQDLMRMLDQIRDLAEAGARDAAREALAQVDRMLEQLSQARVMRQDMQQLQQMMQGLRETQQLIQRQQRLMDETYQRQRGRMGQDGQGQMRQGRQGRQQGRQGQQGMGRQGQQGQMGQRGQGRQGQQGQMGQGQQGQQGQMGQGQQGQRGQGRQPGQGRGAFGSDGELASRQEALRRALGEVMRQMGENGDIPGGLGGAERSMRDAVGGLRLGDGEGALGAQGDALRQMQQAAREMARQLAEQMRGGEGENRGFANGEGRDQPGGEDPLGRATRGRSAGAVELPGAGDAQRARAIRDEVRRRAGDRARPTLELEYLERLLKRF